MKKISDIRQKR